MALPRNEEIIAYDVVDELEDVNQTGSPNSDEINPEDNSDPTDESTEQELNYSNIEYDIVNPTGDGNADSSGEELIRYIDVQPGQNPSQTLVTVVKEQQIIINNYDDEYLRALHLAGYSFYVVYTDGSRDSVDWTEVADPNVSVEEALAISAEAIGAASNQHFWTNTNGIHVTEDTQLKWITEYDKANHGELGNVNSIKPWHNILINSLGILLRRGLFNYTAMSKDGIIFYDSTGNEASNILAYFSPRGAQIGRSSNRHIELTADGLDIQNGSGVSEAFFGSTARLGASDAAHAIVNNEGLFVYDAQGNLAKINAIDLVAVNTATENAVARANEAAASASNAATSASNAATSASNAASDASAAATSASNAATSASNAASSASDAAESASNAAESASNAATSASNALTKADEASVSASDAASSASNAEYQAGSAAESARGALYGLDTVQDVVNITKWIADHKVLTSDTTPQSGTVYYKQENNGQISKIDPYDETSDTTPQTGVVYYTNQNGRYIVFDGTEFDSNTVYYIAQNPSQKGYYVLDEKVANYLASHLVQTNYGLNILVDNNNTYVNIGTVNGNEPIGFHIIDNNGRIGQSVTENNIKIGVNSESHLNIDYHSIQAVSKEQETYFHVSDLRDHDGYYEILVLFEGNPTLDNDLDDYVQTFKFNSLYYPLDDTYDIKQYTFISEDSNERDWVIINGENVLEKTRYQFKLKSVVYNRTYAVSYRSNAKYLKAFTFGNRKNHWVGEDKQPIVGVHSVALGYDVAATGLFSYAEGYEVSSEGFCSHAEGYNTTARSDYTHAEGENSHAYGMSSHAEGRSTTAGEAIYSHAEGYRSEAYREYSHAEGYQTYARAPYAHTEGYKTLSGSDAWNDTSYAAHAEGYETVAYRQYSHAEGYKSKTGGLGIAAHAEGCETEATGKYSHAEGHETLADGEASHTEGQKTEATRGPGHAEGYMTKSNGSAAHAEGSETETDAANSHVEGELNKIISYGYAKASHAEGYGNTITSNSSTYSYVNASHIEGYQNTISGGDYGVHAEGWRTSASGVAAHSEGYQTQAPGFYSHAAGYGTIASGEAQTVVGKFNSPNTDPLFIVGGGTSEVNQKNVFSVLPSGTVNALGNVALYRTDEKNVAPSANVWTNMTFASKTGQRMAILEVGHETSGIFGMNLYIGGTNAEAHSNSNQAGFRMYCPANSAANKTMVFNVNTGGLNGMQSSSSSWISAKDPYTAAIYFPKVADTTGSRYDSLMAGKSTGDYNWTLGIINRSMYLGEYTSTQTENSLRRGVAVSLADSNVWTIAPDSTNSRQGLFISRHKWATLVKTNGSSGNFDYGGFYIGDATNFVGRVFMRDAQASNGQRHLYLEASRTIGSTRYYSRITAGIDASGNAVYGVTNAANFRSAIGAAASSDRRLKTDLKLLDEDAVEFVKSLKPYSYLINGERQVGLIAQDVYESDKWGTRMAFETQEGIDGLDDWEKLGDGIPTWKLDYIRLIPPTITALQKAMQKIESLEERIRILEGV